MNKTKTAAHLAGGVSLTFYSDVDGGEVLDTDVFISGGAYGAIFLCTIAGCDIESFKNDLSALVDRYKI